MIASGETFSLKLIAPLLHPLWGNAHVNNLSICKFAHL